MIVPDLNLPLYAYDPSSAQHKAARVWWEQLLSGTATVGLPWIVALGFIRISTNPRVYRNPAPVSYATGVVRE